VSRGESHCTVYILPALSFRSFWFRFFLPFFYDSITMALSLLSLSLLSLLSPLNTPSHRRRRVLRRNSSSSSTTLSSLQHRSLRRVVRVLHSNLSCEERDVEFEEVDILFSWEEGEGCYVLFEATDGRGRKGDGG